MSFLDYHFFRLATDEVGMEAVLQLAKRFLPQPNDLSFYNWDTRAVTSSPTANFEVSGPAYTM